MNQKQAKIVLILIAVILILLFVLIYLQAISIEHFSNNNLVSSQPQTLPISKIPSAQPQTVNIGNNSRLPGKFGQSFERSQSIITSPINNMFPTDNFVMVHDTILEEYDITNPVLTPDDIIYQTTKYQALRGKGRFNDFGNFAPVPSPSFGSPAFGKPAKPITFPCTVVVSYSNYKDKNNNLDPFLNKTMSVTAYDSHFAAYTLTDETGNAIILPGVDGMYTLWALSVSNNSIICGWNQSASDKAPTNNYPNKLVLYVKNVL